MKKFNKINSVDIVGVGGTGSWLMEIFSKLEYFMVDRAIFLYDFDIVEYKNIERQNFDKKDVGRPKASQTKIKLSKTNCYAINKRYSTENVNIAGDVIIGLVDTITSRHEILQVMSKSNMPKILIDTGNEDTYGQVMLIYYDGEDFIVPEAYVEILSKTDGEVRQGACTDYIEQTSIINKSNASLTTLVYSYLMDHIDKYNQRLYQVNLSSDSSVKRRSIEEYDNIADVIKTMYINNQEYINSKSIFELDENIRSGETSIMNEYDNAFEYAFYMMPSIFWNSYTPSSDNSNELIALSIQDIHEINHKRIKANEALKRAKNENK